MAIATNFPSINPTLLLDFANSGRVDPRVTFTRASSATFFDQTGVLRTAATNVPRLDYNPSTLAARGFLIEESRTNSIRNNTMQGAVAGTPGTLPTNWQISGSGLGTLTSEVVGTGVVNGIAYIDLRISGTSSTTGLNYAFEPNAGVITASSGQTWTASVYVALVGGSLSNINQISGAAATGRTSGGGGTTDNFTSGDNKSVLTSTLQRFSVTGTLADATTATIQPYTRVNFSSGLVIDITLRIGLPQLEQGAFATSVIPTTTTAVTRAADAASVNTLSPWYNASAGTLYAEFVWEGLKSVAGQRILSFDDGTSSNFWSPLSTSVNGMQGVVQVGGVAEATNNSPATTFTAGTLYKQALALELNNSVSAINGTAGTPDTSVTVPTVNTLRLAASASGATNNIWFRRITYYPRRLSNAELQSITT